MRPPLSPAAVRGLVRICEQITLVRIGRRHLWPRLRRACNDGADFGNIHPVNSLWKTIPGVKRGFETVQNRESAS